MEWKEIKISGLLEVGEHSPSSSLVTNLLWDLVKSRFLDLEMAQTFISQVRIPQIGGGYC